MIKNILFDLDDTLLDFKKAEKAALAKTLKYLNIEPREQTLKRYSEINAEQWRLLEKGELTREQIKERRYQLLFDELGVVRSPREATAYYERMLGMEHSLTEDAQAVLEALYTQYRLYIVTNGTLSVQKSRIEKSGIGRYFSGVFISQELGYNKPDPRFFEICFAQIPDLKKEQTVIVGDSLSSDIKGGQNAGICTVWLNQTGEPVPERAPDFEIHALTELPALLTTL